MIRSQMNKVKRSPTLVERMEDIAGDLYSYAADEYNLSRVSGEPEYERYLTAYNLMVDALNALAVKR